MKKSEAYKVLNVTPPAGRRSVEESYWELAHKYRENLDHEQEAPQRLLELNEAYFVLTSRERLAPLELAEARQEADPWSLGWEASRPEYRRALAGALRRNHRRRRLPVRAHRHSSMERRRSPLDSPCPRRRAHRHPSALAPPALDGADPFLPLRRRSRGSDRGRAPCCVATASDAAVRDGERWKRGSRRRRPPVNPAAPPRSHRL
jgi:curved DNA-binding protein CbpA